MDDPLLSQELAAYLDNLDWERNRHRSEDERKQARQAGAIIRLLTKNLVASREKFLEQLPIELEKLVSEDGDIKYFLDSYYTRQQLDAIAGMVRRTQELSRLKSLSVPSEQTQIYVREATRAYVYNLGQACAILCRAALEQALKEHIQGKDLKEMVKKAHNQRILDQTTSGLADDIRE